MRSLALFCFRRRWWVLGAWLAALVVLVIASNAVGPTYANTFSLPKTESTKALNLLRSVSRAQSGDTEQVVVAAKQGATLDDPAVKARVTAMLETLTRSPHVSRVDSPYSADSRGQISRDRTVGFASVTLDSQAFDVSRAAAVAFVDTATAARGGNLDVAVAGQVAQRAGRQGFGGGGIGILAAAVVLFVVFGSFLAMTLPLISALVSLGAAISLVGLLSHVLKLPQFASELIVLIGLGVGVDYALFIVSRHRQGLVDGLDTEESVVASVDTSGRAVLFAGIIVCIALLGMFALRVSFLYGLAVAASIGVLFTMLAALTLLPALLGFFGPRVLSRRQRRQLGTASAPDLHGGFWPRWTAFVERHSVLTGAAALAVMIAFAIPFLSLRLGNSDSGNDPKNTTTRQAYDLLARGFGPGFNGPLQVVAEVRNDADRAVVAGLAAKLRTTPDVASVGPVRTIQGANEQVALVVVYPRSAPQDAATTDLVHRLRRDAIPAAVGGRGTLVYVGGTTAVFQDFAHVLTSKLPVFIGVVVALSFVLLAVVFRSLAIPLTAAVMNLLSASAAFGILVAVFQWGWLGRLFGVNRSGPVEAFLPVMLFAILFGLSMDYEVFLISRVHEEWLHTGDNSRAVARGLAATGRTITAAALIMVAVFGAFILGGERVIKEFGLGLAGAIAVDAVVVRSAVIPAVMLTVGKANWWFPRRLDRVLPRLSVEPPEVLAEVSAGSPAD